MSDLKLFDSVGRQFEPGDYVLYVPITRELKFMRVVYINDVEINERNVPCLNSVILYSGRAAGSMVVYADMGCLLIVAPNQVPANKKEMLDMAYEIRMLRMQKEKNNDLF